MRSAALYFTLRLIGYDDVSLFSGSYDEWTADPNGTFRGGYYVDTVINGPGCLYTTTAHDTSYVSFSTGFRCCVDF